MNEADTLLKMFFVLFCLLFCVPSSQGGTFSSCTDGMLLARENSSLQTWCFYTPMVDGDTLTWGIRPWRDQPSLEIVCVFGIGYGCSNYPHPHLTISWDIISHIFTMTIDVIERNMFISSTILCNETTTDKRFTKFKPRLIPCMIDVVFDADVTSCYMDLHKPSWSFNGSCDVTKVYSSAGHYGYTVVQNYARGSRYYINKRYENYTSSLTSFTDTSSGYVYFRGVFPFEFRLPSNMGNLTVDVQMNPGNGTHIEQTILIEPPSNPELANCNHQTFIEGGNFPATRCECRVTSLGSPSGRLQWVADDVVLASGEYGVTQLVFPYDKLTRTHDGMDMGCQVDWVVRKNSVNFTAQLFYGPDGADIFLLTSLSHSVNYDVTLLCEPFDVNPASHMVITWGGLCQGQQGLTCTLTPPVAKLCGKEVTCTVANQKIPGKQAIARMTVELDSCTAQKLNTARRLWEGVGIGASVVVLVVVVVVMMVWRRRLLLACRCCYQTYDSPSKKRQKEEEEQHTYTDLSPYDSIVDGPGTSLSANQKTTSRTASSVHNEPGNQPTNQHLPTTPGDQGLDGNQSDANHNNAANRSANSNLSRHNDEEGSQTKEEAQTGEIYTHDYLELVPDSPPQKPVE